MQILRYPLGELQANCYLLVKDKKCLMIDPGDSADFLLEEISRQNLTFEAMLATHGHFDHIMGAGNLQTSVNIPLSINENDTFLVKRLKRTAEYFLKQKVVVISPKTINLKDGKFRISSFEFRVLSTPGHTPGSSCFYFEKEKALFTGDTLFKDAIGAYDHKYSSKEDLFDSIRAKLFILPDETIIYPGHGDSSTIVRVRSSVDLPRLA